MRALRGVLDVWCLDSDRCIGLEDNIKFELNHLELHGLDEYLLACYDKDLFDEENTTNSNIKYVLCMTDSIRDGPVETIGGSWPD